MNPGKVIMGSTNIGIEDIKKILEDMFKQHQEVITKKRGGNVQKS